MKNKTIRLLSLALILFIILACSTFSGGPSEEDAPVDEAVTSEAGGGDETVITEEAPDASESSLCAHEYYPVADGASWSYAGTSTGAEDYSFTNTITSTRSDGFTVTVEFDNLTLIQEWACIPDGILALDMGGGAAGTLTTDNVNLVIDTQNASGITYPNEITPGKTWQHALEFTGTMDFNGESVDVSGNTIYNYTAVGVESVSVPAGTFEAMKLDVTTTINFNMNMAGSEVPVAVTSTGSSWFAPDIGWVKSVSTTDMAGFASTDTIDLQSYSIP